MPILPNDPKNRIGASAKGVFRASRREKRPFSPSGIHYSVAQSFCTKGYKPRRHIAGDLALHFLSKLNRKNHWTIAEDRAFRAAVKNFAFANEQKAFDTTKVVLPGNLPVALVPAEDAPLQTQRDKFVKTLFDKIKAGGK